MNRECLIKGMKAVYPINIKANPDGLAFIVSILVIRFGGGGGN
jgi:hypothetical protein